MEGAIDAPLRLLSPFVFVDDDARLLFRVIDFLQ